MKINTPLLIVASVAMTGCINLGSFNTSNPSQTPAGGTAAPRTSAKPTPPPKTQAKPTPAPQAAKPSPSPAAAPSKAPATPAPAAQPTPAAVQPSVTPKPAPSSRVIKEETSSETKVISSRPVVGSDADMGQ